MQILDKSEQYAASNRKLGSHDIYASPKKTRKELLLELRQLIILAEFKKKK